MRPKPLIPTRTGMAIRNPFLAGDGRGGPTRLSTRALPSPSGRRPARRRHPPGGTRPPRVGGAAGYRSLSSCAIACSCVAVARGGVPRDRGLDARRASSSSSVTSSAPSASCSRSRRRAPITGTMSSPRESDPGDRHLGDGRAALARRSGGARRRARRLRSRLPRWKRGAWARKSLAGRSRCGGPVAGEQAAGEHAVGGDADAELARRRQDLVLDPARDQRVLDLQVGDRVDGGGAADRLAPTSDRPMWRT